LARFVVVAPAGSWALKDGQALLARLDTQARATKDADTTRRAALEHFDDVLEAAVDTDLGDGFRFEVAAPRPMTAETDEEGLRYPVLPWTVSSSATSSASPVSNRHLSR
jgi:hypothetical protein